MKKTYRVLLSACCVAGLLVSSPVYADEQQALLEQTVKAYESGDYATTKTLLNQLVALGNVKAMNNMGVMYQEQNNRLSAQSRQPMTSTLGEVYERSVGIRTQ